MDKPESPPVEMVDIDRLYCSPTNPRRNDAAVPHVASSLRRFGWQQPIVARPSGEVIAGNTRLKAAQDLGMTEVPVWWFEGDDLEAVAYCIADNRSHSFSQFHEPDLAVLLQQLRKEDALDGVGFTEDDLDELLEQLREQDEVDNALDDDGPRGRRGPAAIGPARRWRSLMKMRSPAIHAGHRRDHYGSRSPQLRGARGILPHDKVLPP